jgi:hypothetical protein
LKCTRLKTCCTIVNALHEEPKTEEKTPKQEKISRQRNSQCPQTQYLSESVHSVRIGEEQKLGIQGGCAVSLSCTWRRDKALSRQSFSPLLHFVMLESSRLQSEFHPTKNKYFHNAFFFVVFTFFFLFPLFLGPCCTFGKLGCYTLMFVPICVAQQRPYSKTALVILGSRSCTGGESKGVA